MTDSPQGNQSILKAREAYEDEYARACDGGDYTEASAAFDRLTKAILATDKRAVYVTEGDGANQTIHQVRCEHCYGQIADPRVEALVTAARIEHGFPCVPSWRESRRGCRLHFQWWDDGETCGYDPIQTALRAFDQPGEPDKEDSDDRR